MNLTVAALREIAPHAKPGWLEAIVHQAPLTEVDTPNEMASFMAQICHESCGLTAFEENLNYRPEAILSTFNRKIQRFTAEQAQKYGRTTTHPADQVMIANIAYANRCGNGAPDSGDGWFYHGRGAIQLTFHDNYFDFETDSGHHVITEPDLLLTPEVGIECAFWFWKKHGLDHFDDDDDVRAETRLVNGGEMGLAERQAVRNHAVKVFGG